MYCDNSHNYVVHTYPMTKVVLFIYFQKQIVFLFR